MAWGRIDDGALTHPKIVGMVDYRRPLDLWFWGIIYAQTHLTDGYIPADALPLGCLKAKRELERRKLWDITTDGNVQIHDYLQWNDSRDEITAKRASSRERMAKYRKRTNGEVTRNVTTLTSNERASTHVPRGVVQSSTSLEDLDSKTNARSKRPIFTGQRFVVFEWMFDDIRQILGPYLDDFNLDEWFYDLDAKATRMNLVIPKRDKGAWLQAQLLEEARRRGLRIAGTNGDDSFQNLPTAWQCVCGEIHEGTQEQRNRGVCLMVRQDALPTDFKKAQARDE